IPDKKCICRAGYARHGGWNPPYAKSTSKLEMELVCEACIWRVISFFAKLIFSIHPAAFAQPIRTPIRTTHCVSR
ncbi:MAG: hypothetical protein NUV63_10940, partial [Gallionella sp.]|nr:hypothetical protein [Gallionella sp.]